MSGAMNRALQGATAGMPQGQPQAGAMQQKFQTVIAGVKELLMVLSKMPGTDQQKLQQAVGKLQEGMQLIAAAIGGGGKTPPGGAPPPPGAPPPA